MSQLGVIWRKEMYESWSNRRWIWLPLVFILLGVMQPVSTHFMPQILKMSGGLPAGTVIQFPTPSPADVYTKAQAQYSTLGLLVLVLAFMGSISNERQYGVLELIMVKPVKHATYIVAKWLSAATITLVSLFLGDLASWYYTGQLIGALTFAPVFASAIVYGVWLLLIVTLSLSLSTMIDSAIANAFISLIAAIALSVAAGVLNWPWSPGGLPTLATQMILGAKPGTIPSITGDLLWSLTITLAILIALLGMAIGWFKRKTFA